jgi:hypothetical protein
MLQRAHQLLLRHRQIAQVAGFDAAAWRARGLAYTGEIETEIDVELMLQRQRDNLAAAVALDGGRALPARWASSRAVTTNHRL